MSTISTVDPGTVHGSSHAPGVAHHLAAPVVGTGAFMAAYLVLRPYGDAGGGATLAAAQAFASPWWVVSHLCGVLALASFARLALRLQEVRPGHLTRAARRSALAGVVLVLPYYGAETFALQVLGRAGLTGDRAALELVAPVRDHPVAMGTFGLGLLLLAIAALLVGWVWQRAHGPAAWPLALFMVCLLPQFFLPPAGRMAYGVLYAVAALLLLLAAARAGRAAPEERSPGR